MTNHTSPDHTSPDHTSPDPHARADVLGLGSILVSSLPAALLTPEEPERYTVEAVFTRKPDAEELAGIADPATTAALRDAGYPDVSLRVADRRLQIAHTTLEELRDGLGDVIAAVLARISTEAQTDRSTEAERRRRSAAVEHERAAAVVELARAVSFSPGVAPSRPVAR